MLCAAYVLNGLPKVSVVCTAIFLTELVLAKATASKSFTAFQLSFTFHLLGMSLDERRMRFECILLRQAIAIPAIDLPPSRKPLRRSSVQPGSFSLGV